MGKASKLKNELIDLIVLIQKNSLRYDSLAKIMIIISELQTQMLILESITEYIESKTRTQNSLNSMLLIISKFLNLRFIIPNYASIENNNLFWSILIMCMLYLMTLIIFLYYSISCKEYTIKSKFIMITSLMQMIHKHILIFYIADWMFIYFKSFVNADEKSLVLFIFCITFSLINFIMGLIFYFFMTYCLKDEKNNVHCNSLDGCLIIIMKLIIILSIFWDNTSSLYWVMQIILIILCIIRPIMIWYNPPYYDIKLLNFILCSIGIIMILSIFKIIITMTNSIDTEYHKQFLALIFLISYMISIIYRLSNKLYSNIIQGKTLQTEKDYLLRFLNLEKLFNIGYGSNYIYKNIPLQHIIIFGEFKSHIMNCINCPLEDKIHNFSKGKDDETFKIYSEIKFHILINILDNGINATQKSKKLNLSKISYLIESRYMMNKAIILLEKLSNTKHISFNQKLQIKLLKIKINEYNQSLSESNGINFEMLNRCEEFYKKFINLLLKHAEYYQKFWNFFQENTIESHQIIDISNKIHKDYLKIKKTWDIYCDEYSKIFYKPKLAYSNLLILVKNQSAYGETILDSFNESIFNYKHNDNIDDITEHNLFSEKNISILISGQKECIGQISSCNNYIQTVLGYDNNEMKNKNLSYILPNHLKQHHNNFILNYYETGKNNVINKTTQKFAMHKEGYLVPIHLHIKMLTTNESEIVFLGLMRPREIFSQVLIIRNNGMIDSGTQQILEQLNLINKKNGSHHILDLCSDKRILTEITKETETKLNVPSLENENLFIHKPNSSILILKNPIENLESNNESSFVSRKKVSKFINYNIIDKIPEDGIVLTFKKYSNRPERLSELYASELMNYHVFAKKENIIFCDPVTYLTLLPQNIDDQNEKLYNRLNIQMNQEIPSDSKRSPSIDESPKKLRFRESKLFNSKEIKMKTNLMFLSMNPMKVSIRGCNGDVGDIGDVDDVGDIGDRNNNPSLNDKLLKEIYKKNEDNKINSIKFLKKQTLSTPNSPFKSKIMSNSFKEEGSNKISYKEESQKLLLAKVKNRKKDRMDELALIERSSMQGKRTSKAHFLKKLDQALESPYKSQSLLIKVLLLLILLVSSFSGVFILYTLHTNTIQKVQNYQSIIDVSGKRLLSFTELGRRIRYVYSMEKGILSRSRFVPIAPDYMIVVVSTIAPSLTRTLLNNSILLNEIGKIDRNFQDQFYDIKIKMYDYDSTGNKLNTSLIVNSFEAIDLMYLKGRVLYSNLMRNIKNMPYLYYLLRNGFDVLLMALMNSSDILQNQISTELDSITRNSKIYLWSISIAGFVLFIQLIITSYDIFKKNKRVLENLFKIKQELIHKEVKNIMNFISYAKEDNFNDNLYDDCLLMAKTEKRKNVSLDHTNKTTKNFIINKVKNFKLRLYCIIYNLQFFILILLISMTFYIKLQLSTEYNNQFIDFINKKDYTNEFFFKNNVVSACMYELLSDNGTSYIIGQPIQNVMDDMLNFLDRKDDFINLFRNSDGFLNPRYGFIFEGDYCATLPLSFQPICVSYAFGVATQGLSSMISFATSTYKEVLYTYENCNKTQSMFFKILNTSNVRELESITSTYTGAFNYLFMIMKDDFNQLGDNFHQSLLIWSIFCSISIVVAFLTLWYPAQKNLREETSRIKKTILMFPKSHMLYDQLIKKYILETSSDIMISLKNSLEYYTKQQNQKNKIK